MKDNSLNFLNTIIEAIATSSNPQILANSLFKSPFYLS